MDGQTNAENENFIENQCQNCFGHNFFVLNPIGEFRPALERWRLGASFGPPHLPPVHPLGGVMGVKLKIRGNFEPSVFLARLSLRDGRHGVFDYLGQDLSNDV